MHTLHQDLSGVVLLFMVTLQFRHCYSIYVMLELSVIYVRFKQLRNHRDNSE